jgi:uridine kinase
MAFYAISGPIGSNIELFAQKLAVTFGDDVKVIAESNYLHIDKSLNAEQLLDAIRSANKDVIVWGHHIYADSALRNAFSHKIFLDADLDTRLANYISKRISNSNLEDVLKDYEKNVKPLNATTIDKYKKYADIVIPEQSQNSIVFELLANSRTRETSSEADDRNENNRKLAFF